MNFFSRVGRVFDRLNSLAIYLAGSFILFMALLVGYSIAARYFHFAYPIWAAQTAEYVLLWSTFLGAAWLLRKRGHVKVDLLVNRVNPKARGVLAIVESVIGAAACIFLAWFGAQVTWDLWQRGVMDVRAVDIPKFSLMLIIPIGSFLLSVEFIRSLYNHLSSLKQEDDKPQARK